MKKTLIALLIIGCVFFGWYKLALRPANASDTVPSTVTIEKGMSTKAIAALLEEQGVIRSARAFSLYARFHKTQAGLQAGTFALKPSMNVAEIVAAMSQGKREQVSITIPEGFTVKDIDALMAEKGISKAGDITACAQSCAFSSSTFLPAASSIFAKRGGRIEGYLYPDTYFVIPDSFTPESFLERLLSTFEDRVVEELEKDITDSGRSLHEIVTMGSLIEEETRTNTERPMVSGILWKRFDNSIGLGVDAAVRYILDKPTATITSADLDVDSPYNLRKYRGLPPGPIANAGLQSIKAALHPEASEYLFYLHGNDGQIRYARTNEEHNVNRAKYLR